MNPIVADIIVKEEPHISHAVIESNDSHSDICQEKQDCSDFDAQVDAVLNPNSTSRQETSLNFTQATFTEHIDFSQYDVEHHRRNDERRVVGKALNITAFSDRASSSSGILVQQRRLPQQCKWCKKLFSSKSSLKRHEIVHNGQRPYQCKLCYKSFQYPWVLKRHGIVHGFDGPKKSAALVAGTF